MTARQEGVNEYQAARNAPGAHYSDGRRWSHISKAWIYAEDWNDREEAARLTTWVGELTAKVARLSALVATMQPVVNAASILDNAMDNDKGDCMDEVFELQAALVQYRTALSGGA